MNESAHLLSQAYNNFLLLQKTQKAKTQEGDKVTKESSQSIGTRFNTCCTDDSALCDCTGAAEQLQGEARGGAADRQDSASQGQQETALSLQADSAPGSSTGPDGPASVNKGGRRGGPKSIASAPKRQMNFWQEEEKAQFLNAYRVSKNPFLLFFFILLVSSHAWYRVSKSPFLLFFCILLVSSHAWYRVSNNPSSSSSPILPAPSDAASSVCLEPAEMHPTCDA